MERLETSFLLQSKEYADHESVFRFADPASGLKGFIAIHNTRLGPALGGTRIFPYGSEAEALDDVLRLSRAMTYKCALAGINYGGGKGVIMADSDQAKTPALLRAYARSVHDLAGKFFTGEDVGVTEADVQLMLQTSPYFIGKSGQAGDPSPYAALSTFFAMQEAVEFLFGSKELHGRRVSIKGLGKVGSELARLLHEAGAEAVGADISLLAIAEIQRKRIPVTMVSPKDIHRQAVDVYAPCALGNEFTTGTAEDVQAKIICGAANNQLTSPAVGDWFFSRQMIYVPDYVANAGGLIDVADELEPGGYQRPRVMNRIGALKTTLREILALSKREQKPTNRIADMLAEDRFNHTHKLVPAAQSERV